MNQNLSDKTITASSALRGLLRTFARHSVREYIANEIDGLKLVHRRILQAIKHGNAYKQATLVGDTMGNLHPHGDSSIKEAADRLAQPYNQCCPLIDSEGNIGAYAGGSAAAMRYLDVKIHPFAEDVFFKNVNPKTLLRVPTEVDDSNTELSYFIPVIPMTLLMGPSSISVAYRSNVPYYNFTDVCNLVIEFIKEKKKHPIDYMKSYKKYAKYLLPDFPVNGYLLNARQIYDSYSKGNFNTKIFTCGTMDLNPNAINIHTIPFGVDFYKTVVLKLRELFKKPSFASANYTDVIDLINEVEVGNLELPLKRGNSPFNDLDKLKKEIRFQQSWSPIWNFSTAEGLLTEHNPIELLRIWYDARYRSIMSDIKLSNIEAVDEYRKVCALIIIRDYAKEVADLFLRVKKPEDTIEPLCKDYGLSIFQARYVSTLKISQFTAQGRDELLQQKKMIEDRLKAIRDSFINIDNTIIEQVKELRDKYSNKIIKRHTKLPNFIGALQIGNDGYIQFDTIEELDTLIRHWSAKADTKIIMYPEYTDCLNKPFNLYYRTGKTINNDFELDYHKSFSGTELYPVSDHDRVTLVLRKDRTISRIEGIHFISEKDTIVTHASHRCTLIDHKWQVCSLDVTEVPKRMNIASQGIKADYIFVSNVYSDKDSEVVVVTANAKDANDITFERAKVGSKIYHSLLSNTKVLAILNPNDTVHMSKHTVINAPDDIIQRCSFKQLMMFDGVHNNIFDYFKGEKKFTVNLFRRSSTNGLTFKALSKGSTMLVPVNK